jgi:hypothetical protein
MTDDEREMPIADAVPAAPKRPVSVAVKTPRGGPEPFRRSEAYLARQIARAVARGQRTL